MRIDETPKLHGKTVHHFEEHWNDEKTCIEFKIVFDDDTTLKITPYVDIDDKFEYNKNDLRLNYE